MTGMVANITCTPWGSETLIRARTTLYDRPMLSLLALVVRALVRLFASARRAGRVDESKDLEILVLGHQLRVLQRTAGPRKLRAIDRVLLAAASRVIPRDRWVAFLVTPATPWGSETRIRSRGDAVVLVDQPTEQIPSANVARTDGHRVRRFGSWRGEAEGATSVHH